MRPRGPTKGTTKLCSDEEFDARQLVVQLACVETVKQTGFIQFGLLPLQSVSSFNNVEIYRDWRVLFGTVRVPKGFDTTYSYTLIISAQATETLYGAEHSVRWQLCAILEASNHPNIQTPTYEVQVARPQINQPPTIMKEIIREVVLIQCSYCSGLIPQASLFYPNCGAKKAKNHTNKTSFLFFRLFI
jgi:hypothetical protein